MTQGSVVADPPSRRQPYVRALADGLAEEMRRDPNVFVMGEDVRVGTFGLTGGLVDQFGSERVRNTPISEAGFVGAAVGAAMCGLRPFVELSIATFAYSAMDQIVNQAAKNRFLFGGQTNVPIVIHLNVYHRSLASAQHTDRPHPMFMNVPGLKIVVASNPEDGKGLLKSAIRDDNPVLMFSDMTINTRRGDVPTDEYLTPLGVARTARTGSDVTIVSVFAVRESLEAADLLADQGISAEVIDPRTLAPLDSDAIRASVRKTGRLVVVDIAHRTCSAASEIAAMIAETEFDALLAPIQRVAAPDLHVPHAPNLEGQLFPTANDIADAVHTTLSGRPRPGTE